MSVFMNNDDLYLSDFHIENPNINNEDDLKRTRIELELSRPDKIDTKDLYIDSDGDIIIERNEDKETLIIEHKLQTKLDDVGFQLWRASLYLCDYLLDNKSILEDNIVVELGSGLGIVSILASIYSKTIYCTDLERIVELADKNWSLNELIIKNIQNRFSKNQNNTVDINFRALEWSGYEDFPVNLTKSKVKKYQIGQDDLETLKKATVFLASDVVYDDMITIKFMNTLYKLMTWGDTTLKRTCFIANEQRINFNTDNFCVTDNAYSFFRACLDDLDKYVDEEKQVMFTTELLSCDEIYKYVKSYKRTEQLYIWKIECNPLSS